MSPLRVLIADDHALFRAGLEALFASRPESGIRLAGSCADGKSALDRLRTGDVDVAVVDHQMGSISGLDLVREASRMEGPAVVLLSSFGAPSLVAESLRAGASGWVLKADAVEDLVEAVGTAARGGIFVSRGIPPAGLRDAMASLGPSPRELEVLELLAAGRTTTEIASLLGVGAKTVETHRSHLFIKLGASNVAAAVAEGMRSGWLRRP